MEKIVNICNQFQVDSPVVGAEKYGCGHINDTYKELTIRFFVTLMA